MRFRFGQYIGLLTMIGILSFDCCFGQTQVENLENKLQSASGIDKIKLLNQLSQLCVKTHPNKSADYGKTALKLAREMGEPGEESSAHINIGHAYNRLGKYEMSISSFSASLTMSEQHQNDMGIAYCLNQIGIGKTAGAGNAAPRKFGALRRAKNHSAIYCRHSAASAKNVVEATQRT